jgi:hypothetical protein
MKITMLHQGGFVWWKAELGFNGIGGANAGKTRTSNFELRTSTMEANN